MNHDVFISFSSANTDVAKKVVDSLEESGEIKCWIAFRDIIPSANYAEQLVEAIESCKLLLLILSDESNRSPQVSREIERAGSKGIPILPLRIEDVVLSKSMEYFISSHHWLDAYEEDIETYFPALKSAVESSILGKEGKPSGTDAATRKPLSKPSKGFGPQKIFAAAVALVLLVLAFFFLRPDQSPSVIEKKSPPATTEPKTVVTPASSQDALIQELVQRYKDNKPGPIPESDGWTSSYPLSIAFLDISGSGMSDAERDFILNKTAEELRESKRYSIIEREIIDKLLDELNLSTSALADPATALKLGRILSARLIVTGNLSMQDKQWLASLRFIETETTAVKCSVSAIVSEGGADAVVTELGNAIRNKLRKEYPLQGMISSVTEDTAAINIGATSGVVPGMVFSLLQEDNLAVNAATVTAVKPKQSQIALAEYAGIIEKGMRLREDTQE